MGEKRVKSAWEIAMEKIKDLGELTLEEKKEMKIKEYTPKGKAMAEGFLEGVRSSRYLETELLKLKDRDEEKEILKDAALEVFKKAIKIENAKESQRALEGVSILEPDKNIAYFKEKFFLLEEEFKKKIEEAESGKEKQLKIFGSALGEINLEATEVFPDIVLEFNQELNQLKEELW